jgi:transcription factor TFIIIB component B''
MLKKKGALTFKPKAPARRPAAPPSITSSARLSVERHVQTQVSHVQPILPLSASATSIDAQLPTTQTIAPKTTPQAPVESQTVESQAKAGADHLKSPPPSVPSPSAEYPAPQHIEQPSTNFPLSTPPFTESSLPPADLNVTKSDQDSVLPQFPTLNTDHNLSASNDESQARDSVAHGNSPEPPSQLLSILNAHASPRKRPQDSVSTSQAPAKRRKNTPRGKKSVSVPSEATEFASNQEQGQGSSSTVQADTPVVDGSVGVEEHNVSVTGTEEPAQPSQIVPEALLNDDSTSAPAEAAQRRKPRGRPRRKKVEEVNVEEGEEADEDVRPTIEVQVKKPRRSATPKQPRQAKTKDRNTVKKTKKREETPEDSEQQEIDHSVFKMGDLTKDLRIGKKFSKHDEIKKREIERKARAKLLKENPDVAVEEERAASVVPVQEEVPAALMSAGPQMRVINGQIVIDQGSLVVDRHKRAAAAGEVLEEIEENDFTRITTSGTYMKREKNIGWDLESEEKFYNGLRMFGTDFEMISNMFPSRSRRQIKLKFNKEERLYPNRINRTLLGERVPVDFEEYKKETGLEYQEVDVLLAEHKKIEDEHNEEEQRAQAELDEADRQKRAQIHGTDYVAGMDSAKENNDVGFDGKASAASRSKKGKKKKNKHAADGGGEEIEVLGSI